MQKFEIFSSDSRIHAAHDIQNSIEEWLCELRCSYSQASIEFISQSECNSDHHYSLTMTVIVAVGIKKELDNVNI